MKNNFIDDCFRNKNISKKSGRDFIFLHFNLLLFFIIFYFLLVTEIFF